MRVSLLASVLISALLMAGAPAFAQSRQELAERVTALEQQLAAPRAPDAAIMNLDRINSLEQQIRLLTGQVEELQFQNRQLSDEVETLREDMLAAMSGPALAGGPADPGFGGGFADRGFDAGPDGGPTPLAPLGGEQDYAIVDQNDPFAAQRRAAIRPLGAPDSAAGPAAGPNIDMTYRPTGADPDTLFARGRTRLGEGNFTASLDAFAEFLQVAPNDQRAGEAYFWIGKIYRGESQPVEAAQALIESLRLEPNGVFAPEATVDLGAALTEMGEQAQGCQVLAGVARQFPGMDPADLARATREARTAGCS